MRIQIEDTDQNWLNWGQAVWKRPEISVLAIPSWANLL